MDKDCFKTVAGRPIESHGIDFPRTYAQLTAGQRRAFCEQCEDYEPVGQVSAADYNNWGCCLAWDGARRAALGKFAAGLAVAQEAELKRILRANTACLLPGLPRGLEALVAEEEEEEEHWADLADLPGLADLALDLEEEDEEGWGAEDDEAWGDL